MSDPDIERIGRWICWRCPFPQWTVGAYWQWRAHYEQAHNDEDRSDAEQFS